MKILIIPDIHGRTFWRNAINLIDKYNKIIFLGDYLDPYPNEKITWDKAEKQFKDILKFKEKYLNKVILLCGNHCIHYIANTNLYCSRYNKYKSLKMSKLYNNYDFKIAYKIDNYIFTHAGITKSWLNDFEISLNDLFDKTPKEFILELSAVGFLRGGNNKTGSCVWCDLKEFIENKHDIKYYQIFGHTQLKNEYISEDFACLDCKKCFELDTNTKIIKSI